MRMMYKPDYLPLFPLVVCPQHANHLFVFRLRHKATKRRRESHDSDNSDDNNGSIDDPNKRRRIAYTAVLRIRTSEALLHDHDIDQDTDGDMDADMEQDTDEEDMEQYIYADMDDEFDEDQNMEDTWRNKEEDAGDEEEDAGDEEDMVEREGERVIYFTVQPTFEIPPPGRIGKSSTKGSGKEEAPRDILEFHIMRHAIDREGHGLESNLTTTLRIDTTMEAVAEADRQEPDWVFFVGSANESNAEVDNHASEGDFGEYEVVEDEDRDGERFEEEDYDKNSESYMEPATMFLYPDRSQRAREESRRTERGPHIDMVTNNNAAPKKISKEGRRLRQAEYEIMLKLSIVLILLTFVCVFLARCYYKQYIVYFASVVNSR